MNVLHGLRHGCVSRRIVDWKEVSSLDFKETSASWVSMSDKPRNNYIYLMGMWCDRRVVPFGTCKCLRLVRKTFLRLSSALFVGVASKFAPTCAIGRRVGLVFERGKSWKWGPFYSF